ncbi:MAG: ATP-binding protein [Candidatus Coatesbacteria bacterium]|nr:ATP-binding protein [Candidatus Coatesbacteria bacterium]
MSPIWIEVFDMGCASGTQCCCGPDKIRHVREIRSDLRELSGLRAFVRQVCSSTLLDEDRTAQLELAANETVCNIIKHSYGGRADGRIMVQVEALSDRLTLRLYHWGKAYDPESQPIPQIETFPERGFGLYIIRHTVDEVRYFAEDDGRNCVLLTKFL